MEKFQKTNNKKSFYRLRLDREISGTEIIHARLPKRNFEFN